MDGMDAVENALSRCVELNPDDAHAHQGLAFAAWKLDRFEETRRPLPPAIKLASRALSVSPAGKMRERLINGLQRSGGTQSGILNNGYR